VILLSNASHLSTTIFFSRSSLLRYPPATATRTPVRRYPRMDLGYCTGSSIAMHIDWCLDCSVRHGSTIAYLFDVHTGH
jgi:hypothetical protein